MLMKNVSVHRLFGALPGADISHKHIGPGTFSAPFQDPGIRPYSPTYCRKTLHVTGASYPFEIRAGVTH
jgi:hypothetical protein